MGRKGVTSGRSAISAGSIVSPAGTGGIGQAVESCRWCSISPDMTIPPTENSSTSGGNGRVLGDWPRRIMRPRGALTEALRSAEISTMNLSRAMARSVVLPFLTGPSLISVSICGETAHAIYVLAGGRPLRIAIGVNRERPSAVTSIVNGPGGLASSTRPDTPRIPGAATSSMQYRSWLGPSGLGASHGRPPRPSRTPPWA